MGYMVKRASGAEREARRRARSWVDVPLVDVPEPPAPAAPGGWMEGLEAVAADLRRLEVDRAALVARRDELVAGLRAAGASWDVLAAAAGTTRQALMKRG